MDEWRDQRRAPNDEIDFFFFIFSRLTHDDVGDSNTEFKRLTEHVSGIKILKHNTQINTFIDDNRSCCSPLKKKIIIII